MTDQQNTSAEDQVPQDAHVLLDTDHIERVRDVIGVQLADTGALVLHCAPHGRLGRVYAPGRWKDAWFIEENGDDRR